MHHSEHHSQSAATLVSLELQEAGCGKVWQEDVWPPYADPPLCRLGKGQIPGSHQSL